MEMIIKSTKSFFGDFGVKEVEQVLSIKENGIVKLKSFGIEKELIRDEEYKFDNKIVEKLILSVKTALNEVKNPFIIYDAGTWNVDIYNGEEVYSYEGSFLDENKNKKILTLSNYIRSILKIDGLLLLDGNES